MCVACGRVSRRFFCAGIAALGVARATTRPWGLLEPVTRIAATGKRRVAVTLDACPGHFDHRVADALVAHQIPATIFVTAAWMAQNPEGLGFLLAHRDLFELENHGARHLPAVLGTARVYGLAPAGTPSAITAEIRDGAAAIAKATGRTPSWYRGAAALYSPAAIPLIASLGCKLAGISLVADAGASLPAPVVARRILAARDGDVIQGHINQPRRSSGAGIAAGLVALQAAGAEFVRLDEV